MTETQKKAIMGMVVKILISFNLPRKEYLKLKQDIYDYLYGEKKHA